MSGNSSEDEIFGKFPFHHRHFDGLLVLERGWTLVDWDVDSDGHGVMSMPFGVEVASVPLL